MTSLMVSFVVAALLVSVTCADSAVRLPTPTVAYQTNPDPANMGSIIPTAEPLVLLSTMAFMCYSNAYGGDSYCQMVSPANEAYSAPRVTLNTPTWDSFDMQPLQLTPDSAVYSTQRETGAFWAASSPTAASTVEDRFNSTARVTTDHTKGNVFIPYGVHAGMDFVVSANALNVSDITTNYVLNFSHAANRDGLSLLHDVIHYRGQLLFMHNNTFYQYNATTHVLIRRVENPCRMDAAENGMTLARGTFGQDANGDLDAFIVYGNTTKSVNGVSRAGFIVCRVSHNTGLTKWNFTLAEDFVVDDVSAGAGLIFLSGYGMTTGSPDFQTLVIDATTGTYYNHIARSTQDRRSFPVVVPSNVMPAGCGSALIMQQHLNVSAFCLTPLMGENHTVDPLWVNPAFQCNQRPLFDPLTQQVVCVYSGKYVVSLNATTGAGVWLDTSRFGMTSPQLVIENGVSYAYVLDLDATLWGYQIALSLPTPAPTPVPTPAPTTPSPQGQQAAPSGGLGGGAVAAIVIVVIAVVGGLVAFAVLRGRNMMRRNAYQAPINAE